MPPARKPAAAHYDRVEVTSRAQLRSWLQRHHASSPGVWVVAYKKGSGKPRVDNAEIGEVALCFGWVDSKVAKLDELRAMLLITPRKPKSAWSRVNKARIERLTKDGLMHPAGLAVVEEAKKSGRWTALDEVENLTIPPDLKKLLGGTTSAARKHFEAFPRSAKRAILEWISTAKKPETRAARVEETARLAAQNIRANQWRQ